MPRPAALEMLLFLPLRNPCHFIADSSLFHCALSRGRTRLLEHSYKLYHEIHILLQSPTSPLSLFLQFAICHNLRRETRVKGGTNCNISSISLSFVASTFLLLLLSLISCIVVRQQQQRCRPWLQLLASSSLPPLFYA